MRKRPTVFLDFDDTLSDLVPFFIQFVREIGHSLSGHFGGESDAWEKAAADMLVVVEEDYKDRFVGNPTNGYLEWLNALRYRSVQLVFDAMSLPVPPDAEQHSVRMQFDALSKCDAAFPGAAKALATLSRQGYTLHMASGQESEYLRGGLTGMGIARYVGHLFGPDLVDCAKEGPEFYARVFAAAGVRSEEVIVVDDYPPAIGWALAQGATVIQAKLSRIRHEATIPGVIAVVTDLNTLPEMIAQIAAAA